MNIENTYFPIYALDQENFGLCYYCGCEATQRDCVPPLRYLAIYEKHYGVAQRMAIPCCAECHGFLIAVSASSLEERVKVVKNRISSKYKKALRIYSSWDQDDLDELSVALQKSIRSGIALGEEAYMRLCFKGFSYEYEGQRSHAIVQERVTYEVLGDIFENLRDALLFASRSYKINIHKLEEYFLEVGGDIQGAVARYFSDMEKALLEKKIKDLCKEFCKLHNQSPTFVEKTVRIYLDMYEDQSVEWCLDKIFRERITR
ncbi:hypothetical protein ACYZT8_09415 [Pseudomonas sp. LB3P93]